MSKYGEDQKNAAYPDDNPKTVMGMAKPSLTAIPPTALLHMGGAMSDGRTKYGLMNWREKKVSTSIYIDAAMRHMLAFWDGENTAKDSGVHHLGHVMACMAIILDAESVGMLNDDRPKEGNFAAEVARRTVAFVNKSPEKNDGGWDPNR